jgi:hypothetical protein
MLKQLKCLFTALRFTLAEFEVSTGTLCRRHRLSDAEAVKLFKANPLRWLRTPNGPYTWSAQLMNGIYYSPTDIGIYVGDRAIGYVEGLLVDNRTKTARVRHIAVSKGLEGLGLGLVIAHALRLGLATNYQVRTIIFAEDSTRYIEAGYPAFFSRLGATMVIETTGWRPVWRWE